MPIKSSLLTENYQYHNPSQGVLETKLHYIPSFKHVWMQTHPKIFITQQQQLTVTNFYKKKNKNKRCVQINQSDVSLDIIWHG